MCVCVCVRAGFFDGLLRRLDGTVVTTPAKVSKVSTGRPTEGHSLTASIARGVAGRCVLHAVQRT